MHAQDTNDSKIKKKRMGVLMRASFYLKSYLRHAKSSDVAVKLSPSI